MRISKLGLCALLAATSVNAATKAEIEDFDLNGNGFIEPGQEVRLLKNHLMAELTAEQETLASNIDDPGFKQKGIPVDLLAENSFEKRLKAKCAPDDQRFYLRKSMFDVSVLDQKIAGRVDDGAEFSVAGNPSTGFLQWSVAGAAAFVLRDTCPVVPEGRAPQDLLISGWAVAPYIEFSGSGTSAAFGNSLLKAGVKTELQLFAGSLFDVQQVQIAPYALTDFGFAGRGYGVTVDWIPVRLDAHLNGYIGTADQTAWWWTFKLNADALRVDSPGATGLPTAYYAWAGGKIGLNAKFKVWEKAPALTVGADYSFFHDFLGGTNAGLFSAAAKMPLNTGENASLVLDYKIGSDHKALQNLNRVKLSLAVKF